MSELRKPPAKMPSTPEELLAFVSWPDLYEGETDEEHKNRLTLCETLGRRYAAYMKKKVGVLLAPEENRVWTPKPKQIKGDVK
jgi:hypothetical protein